MKKLILLIVMGVMVLPAWVFAETALERPHWSLELKGGEFFPAIDNWAQYYGKKYTAEYGGSLAYKVLRQVDVGIEGNYVRDKGQGLAPIHNLTTGNVTYTACPVNVFVLLRGVFSEQQWLVPYVGGGWTRIFYKEEVENQSPVRGAVNGYHSRAGIQLLLDSVDASASNSFYLDYGVFHTYLFLEAEYTHAMADTVSSGRVNLGGRSWLGGLLFEF